MVSRHATDEVKIFIFIFTVLQPNRAREALDHQKFMEWLEYHRHEDLKNLIVNQAALRTEVDNLLKSDMAQMIHKMDELSKILISIASRLDEFKGLAAAVAPQPNLSDQAVSILDQFANSGAATIFHAHYDTGTNILFLSNHVPLAIEEERFIRDDLMQLVRLDFLDTEPDGDGLTFRLTRNGGRFLKAVDDNVKVPKTPLPE